MEACDITNDMVIYATARFLRVISAWSYYLMLICFWQSLNTCPFLKVVYFKRPALYRCWMFPFKYWLAWIPFQSLLLLSYWKVQRDELSRNELSEKVFCDSNYQLVVPFSSMKIFLSIDIYPDFLVSSRNLGVTVLRCPLFCGLIVVLQWSKYLRPCTAHIYRWTIWPCVYLDK